MTTTPPAYPPFAPQPAKKSNAGKIVAIIAAVVGLLCLSGVILTACLGSAVDDNRAAQTAAESDQDARNRAAATGQTSTPPAATTAPAKPTKPAKPAPVRVADGTYTVGEDMPAGRYKVTERAENLCTWVRSRGGNAVDAGSGPGFPSFTVKTGDEVQIIGCPEFELRK